MSLTAIIQGLIALDFIISTLIIFASPFLMTLVIVGLVGLCLFEIFK